MTTESDLRDKLSELAMKIAEQLLGDDSALGDQIDGLKTLTDFYAKITKQDSAASPQTNGKWDRLRQTIGGKDAEAG